MTMPPTSRLRPWLRAILIVCAISIPLGVVAQIDGGSIVPSTEGTFYADTWNGTHGNPHNDDFTNIDFPRGFREEWRATPSNAWEQAVAIGADQETFIGVTGHGAGTSPNFYIWDLEGNELFSSDPWTGPEGFDSCAAINTVIIDLEGDSYVSDCNQLWARYPDGTTKWVIELPEAPAGMPFQDTTAGNNNPFVVPFFTVEGAVGGVTAYGDIVIVNREDGTPAYEPFNLGVTVGGTTIPTPPTAYVGTFDPELREWYWNWVFATDMMVSADTPAIATSTGRMFLSAKGSAGGNSMWGIDMTPGSNGALGTVSVAWESDLDQTGGSSPGLSPDETYVAAGTGEGNIRAFNTDDGSVRWNVFNPQAAAGSISVDQDGTVYAVPTGGIAIESDGTVRWRTSDGQLNSLLDDFPCANPPLGCPVVGASSIIEHVGDKIIQSVNVLYPLQGLGINFGAPVANFIVTRDAQSGELVEGSIPFRGHTSLENILSMHKSGRVTIAYGALLASAVQGAAPIINNFLPPGITVMPNDPDLQVAIGIDEATIGDLVDGVIDSGDFKVNLDVGPGQRAVSGTAVIGDNTVRVDIKGTGNGRYNGKIDITGPGLDVKIKVHQVDSIDTGLGSHAAGGTSEAKIKTNGGPPVWVEVDWLIKDWS